MKFQRAALSATHLWSSPFARWQGSLAEISSLDLAVAVTDAALAARDFDRGRVEQIVLGTTIPQQGAFYAAPWIAARLGMAGIGGPHIAQACATSVACIVARRRRSRSIAAARRWSSPRRPHQQRSGADVSAQPGDGGSRWSRTGCSTIRRRSVTGESMVATPMRSRAKAACRARRIDERPCCATPVPARARRRPAFQARTLQRRDRRRQRRIVVDATRASTRQRRGPAGAQARRAAASSASAARPIGRRRRGCVVADADDARSLAGGEGSFDARRGFAAQKRRACRRRRRRPRRTRSTMPDGLGRCPIVNTHNPFAVNDLVRATDGFALERMNPYGCSLVYGHPQGRPGCAASSSGRGLRREGGGVGVFTGCAQRYRRALVLRVD